MTVITRTKQSSFSYTTAQQPSFITLEEKKEYIKHDQLFKELIHNFFEDFLEAFFPDVHEHIDFKSIDPMSEEMFTDLLDGESRRADIVIEAKLKGEETLIIIHMDQFHNYPIRQFLSIYRSK